MRTCCWSDLPEHLLASIARRLDAEIDVLRFRAVCSSWRLSVPLPNSPHRLKFPFPISPTDQFPVTLCNCFALTEHTVYLLQLPGNDDVDACTQQASPRLGWLLRVREEFPGKLRVFNLLFKLRIDEFPKNFIGNLNLLNFRVTELGKLYDLGFVDLSAYDYLRSASQQVSGASFFKKVILSGNSVSTELRDWIVVAIQENGSLCFLRLGDEKWSVIPHDEGSSYCDVLVQNDYFYAVDNKGNLFVFDDSFKLISTIASALVDDGRIRVPYLVKSAGNILLAVRHDQKFCFKVYKLNEIEGNWTEVRDLGDRGLFVGEDGCWSVSAQDFAGCQANCIYFSDILNLFDWGFRGLHGIGVFNLEDGTWGPLDSYLGYSDMFWPPPAWLNSNASLLGC